MRLAIISDIHGNFQALQAVFKDIEQHGIDEIFSLGDNIGYGPEPEKVVEKLIERNIFSVMGNHELAIFSHSYQARLNPISRDSLDLTMPLLSNRSLAWLKTLHPSSVKHKARLVHGCPPDSITSYLFSPSATRLHRVFMTFSEFICFSGHTHALDLFTMMKSGEISKQSLTATLLYLDPQNRYLVVPGSVGQPRDNINCKAKYGIWDNSDHTFEIRAVAYDVDTTIQLLQKGGFPVYNAKRLKW